MNIKFDFGRLKLLLLGYLNRLPWFRLSFFSSLKNCYLSFFFLLKQLSYFPPSWELISVKLFSFILIPSSLAISDRVLVVLMLNENFNQLQINRLFNVIY